MYGGRDAGMEEAVIGEGDAERLNKRSREHRQPENGKESLYTLRIVEDRSNADDEKEGIGGKGNHTEPNHWPDRLVTFRLQRSLC